MFKAGFKVNGTFRDITYDQEKAFFTKDGKAINIQQMIL